MEIISNDYRIKSVLGRLEMIIDNENTRIGNDPQFDLKVSNAIRAVASMSCPRCSAIPIRRNWLLPISTSCTAEEEAGAERPSGRGASRGGRAVADLLKNAVQDADADGTYSQEQFARVTPDD
jgi:hypothetical protein